MECSSYAFETEVEHYHWWFSGRRYLFGKLIGAMQLRKDTPIVDVGSGTGSNLRMFRNLGFTNITGLDNSQEAIRFCTEKGLGPVINGEADNLPFPENSISLVLATDVLEHVDDDTLVLREIHRVLAPGGKALITVPAFSFLWGLQDEVAHHKRRYISKELLKIIKTAGLFPIEYFYFNYLLMGPIWLARKLIRFCGIQIQNENQINSPVLNKILTWIFRFDVVSAPRLLPPFGVSILVIAEKRPS